MVEDGFWWMITLSITFMSMWPLVCIVGRIHGAVWTNVYGYKTTGFWKDHVINPMGNGGGGGGGGGGGNSGNSGNSGEQNVEESGGGGIQMTEQQRAKDAEYYNNGGSRSSGGTDRTMKGRRSTMLLHQKNQVGKRTEDGSGGSSGLDVVAEEIEVEVEVKEEVKEEEGEKKVEVERKEQNKEVPRITRAEQKRKIMKKS